MTLAAVAVKVPVVAEAATVTLAGTVRLVLLLVNATVDPPVGATLLSVTVQVPVPAPVNEAGLQVRPLTVTVAVAFIATVELALAPLAVAVTVPEQSLEIVPAVAEKVAVVAPAATVTEAGVVRRVLLDERVTASPPVAAAVLVVTVQVETALDVSDVGVQARALTVASGDRLREAVLATLFNVAVTMAV